MPHKTTQANIRHAQFWEDIFTVGIWAQQVWTWQWTSTPRICENSSHPQWDARTTATTLAAASRTITNLQCRNTVRTTIMEFYRATTAFNKLKQQTSSSVSTNHGGGTAPMDISAMKSKGKGYKGKGKYKGKSKGKGKCYGGYKGKGKGYKGYGKGPVGQGNPFGQKGQYPQQMNKGKGKGNKGKQAQDVCYRCGQNIVQSQSTITEKHQRWQQSNMTTHNNGMKIHMVMITIGGTTMGHQGQDVQHQSQQLALPAPNATTATDNTPTTQIVSGVHHHGCTCTRRQCRTNNRFNRHYGRQWSSYTCLPTMVCTRVSNTTTISRQRTTTTHSDQQWDQTLRIQVGLHAHCWRATNCHTILCVWRTSTHCISCKTWGTRIYPCDYTSKGLQHNTHQATKPLLPSSNSCTSSTKLYIADPTDKWGNNSNDCTYNAHATRSRTSSRRKQWLLDVQQWRISREGTQDKEESAFPTLQDMSSSNRQVGKLQKDNSQQTWQEQWGLWRTISKPSTTPTEASSTRTSLDWGNLVQVESWYNSTNKDNNSCTTKAGRQDIKQARHFHKVSNIYSNAKHHFATKAPASK